MNIKRFNQIDEGVREFLKPKSKSEILGKFKSDLFKDCDTILEYIKNIKENYQKDDNIDMKEFLKDVVKMEIFDQIIKNRKYDNYDYSMYYNRRLGYLLNASGINNRIEDMEFDDDSIDEEE